MILFCHESSTVSSATPWFLGYFTFLLESTLAITLVSVTSDTISFLGSEVVVFEDEDVDVDLDTDGPDTFFETEVFTTLLTILLLMLFVLLTCLEILLIDLDTDLLLFTTDLALWLAVLETAFEEWAATASDLATWLANAAFC